MTRQLCRAAGRSRFPGSRPAGGGADQGPARRSNHMFINRLSRLTLSLCVAGAVVLSSGCDRGDEGGSGKAGTGDSASGVIKGDKYTIVATLTDQFDRAKA